MNNNEFFEHWYIVPIRWLQAVPNNDGSFIALATALFLYERYVVAKLQQKGMKATKERSIKQITSDFTVNDKTAKIFWNVMRDGLLHQGMPKQLEQGKKTYPDWIFHHTVDSPPIELRSHNGNILLFVQPWGVVNKVIALWQQDIDLLIKSDSFPWAQVFNLNTKDTSGEDFFSVTGSSSGLGMKNID